VRRGGGRSAGDVIGYLAALLVVVAGCGSGGFYGEFVEACRASGDASEELCECMAAYTETNLNHDQKEFLLVRVRGDETRAAEIAEEMERGDAEQVEMLMAGSFGCGALKGEAAGSP
jgi:hypothetical protein